ncbi:molybdenum cofactor guanylyltransferase, partial [Candidatus Woesearchaeota archaeon]|nr:molybdenum cofactor guanylyltransferase [Candidatus Woesearchaeota archaeon]
MENKFFGISAAILAGGKNSRMSGENKAFIRIGQRPIIEVVIKILEGIFEEIILVTNSPEEYKAYEKRATVCRDIVKNTGPLGGIYSALSTAKEEAVFFVACDMPFLHN